MSILLSALDQPSDPADEKALARAAQKVEWNRRRNKRLKVLLPIMLFLTAAVYTYTTNYIPSRSMYPTLKEGDHILTLKAWIAYPMGRTPERGDIVVFIDPSSEIDPDQTAKPRSSLAPDLLIKRVLGLPGETLLITEEGISINDKPIPLPSYWQTLVNDGDSSGYAVDLAFTLKADELFVVGDNSPESQDSREWGPLPRKNVVGRCVRVLFNKPLRDAGPENQGE